MPARSATCSTVESWNAPSAMSSATTAAAICDVAVRDGLARGARGFLTDIEAPSPALDTPAYDRFARLGFRRPYVRTHYARIA
jgi:hypothetical protein